MLQQQLDGAGNAVAVERVGVLVAGNDEQFARFQSAVAAVIVIDVATAVRADVVGPQANLVEIAGAVAILGAVEHGGCGVTHQKMNGLVADLNRHVPMALRRQAEDRQVPFIIPGIARCRIDGEQRARHVLPQEMLEGPYLVILNGVHRVDRHAELAGEEAKSECVIGTADTAVVVQVTAGRDAGVRWGNEVVIVADRLRAILGDRQIVLLEESGRRPIGIEVEFVDEQYRRPCSLDDFRDGLCLGIVGRGQVGDQLALKVAIERRIERRKPHCLRPGDTRSKCGLDCQNQQDQHKQENEQTDWLADTGFIHRFISPG